MPVSVTVSVTVWQPPGVTCSRGVSAATVALCGDLPVVLPSSVVAVLGVPGVVQVEQHQHHTEESARRCLSGEREK